VGLVGNVAGAMGVSAPVVLTADRVLLAHSRRSPPTAFSHVDCGAMRVLPAPCEQ
jgi:hypothetical protein